MMNLTLATTSKFTDPSFIKDSLPVDELQTILDHLLRALFRNGATQDMRGDLYGTLIYYLRHTQPQQDAATITAGGAITVEPSSPDRYQGNSMRLEGTLEESLAWANEKQAAQQLYLRNRCMMQLSAHSERLIEIICSDAANSRDNLRWYVPQSGEREREREREREKGL
jgi:hypothetical protein